MDHEVRDERGFTLIELMMVVMIIAILLAIAVPTYLGARERSEDRAVQANLRNAFIATRIYFTQERAYTDAPADMAAIEPTLEWGNDPLDETAGSTDVYVATQGDDVVVLGARTASGWCFFLRDVMGGADGGTYYDGQAAADGTCAPPSADDIDRPRWSGRVD